MSEIFLTSDLHLGHNNIRVHCSRPFLTLKAMDEQLIARWNSIVGTKDTTYILGDFAWTNHNYYISQLNGKKILIKGNHDKMSQKCFRNFTEVHDVLMRVLCGKHIFMFHYPCRSWPSVMYGSIHCHGHVHGRLFIPDERIIDVGCDRNNYYPFHVEQVIEEANLKEAMFGKKNEASHTK